MAPTDQMIYFFGNKTYFVRPGHIWGLTAVTRGVETTGAPGTRAPLRF